MKKQIIALAIILPTLLVASCSQQKKQGVGGVESSIMQMGDIKNVKIVVPSATIRNGCSTSASVIQTSPQNNRFSVLSKVGSWYALQLPNNQIGFVSNNESTPIVVDNNTTNSPAPNNQAPTPQGSTAPQTPSTQSNSSSLTSDEQTMINLVNQARAQNHVSPLKVDMQVTNIARIKAQDMITNNYFSHYSPKYGSPFDMMKSFGINYIQAGENIAGNANVVNAENTLMNSPGHRANILNPNYTHIGIGIKKGGPYGNMFSQMFISKPQ